MSGTVYDVDFFIRKFEAIPEDQWRSGGIGSATGRRCALGHCGFNYRPADEETPEAKALAALLPPTDAGAMVYPFWGPLDINDNRDPRYRQSTPKARILAALNDIKEKAAQ
jgi:hypothetical protein